jgi:Flp pilus assembly protein TadD
VIERDPVALGAKLQVEAVLEGTIRREGERVRVVAHLVSVRDGSELWAGKFDERLTGILALEDAITERLADALILRLTGAERDLLTKRYTENVEAYQLYLKGRYYSKKHTPEGFKKSVELFERAIRLDQRYALAFAGLAESYHIASETLLPPREAMPKVREMAERALALDPALAEAHLSLGLARAWYDWDFAGAESAFQRSLELNPNFAEAHHYYGVFLALLGQCDQALAELNQAQRLDPLSPNINADFVFPLTCKRQYAPAVARLREAIEIEPNFWVPHFMLGVLLSHQGQWPEARAALNRAGSLSDSPQILAELGRIAALNGDKAQAREALNRLQALSARRYVSPYVMARVYLGLDEKDQALAWLERTYEHRSWWMTFLKFEPGLDGLRSDARFADLLRRVGLSPTL